MRIDRGHRSVWRFIDYIATAETWFKKVHCKWSEAKKIANLKANVASNLAHIGFQFQIFLWIESEIHNVSSPGKAKKHSLFSCSIPDAELSLFGGKIQCNPLKMSV